MTDKATHPNHLTTVRFKLKNVTPGALRYEEINEQGIVLKGDADGAVIGTLYLRKAALKGVIPETLKIDIDNA